MLKLHYLDPKRLVEWVERGGPMPESIGFAYFGTGEKPRKKPEFRIDDKERFVDYVSKGFPLTLFGRDSYCYVECWPDRNDLVSGLSFYDYSDDCAGYEASSRDVITFMASQGVDYAVAADEAEAERRNVLKWAARNRMNVGRDICKYVPGLYWLNYFSDRYLALHELALSEIVESLGGDLERLDDGFLYQLHSTAGDWRDKDALVSTYLSNHPRFFSIDGLPRPGAWLEDGAFVRTSEILKRWP